MGITRLVGDWGESLPGIMVEGAWRGVPRGGRQTVMSGYWALHSNVFWSALQEGTGSACIRRLLSNYNPSSCCSTTYPPPSPVSLFSQMTWFCQSLLFVNCAFTLSYVMVKSVFRWNLVNTKSHKCLLNITYLKHYFLNICWHMIRIFHLRPWQLKPLAQRAEEPSVLIKMLKMSRLT